jgi:hypothetical protein
MKGKHRSAGLPEKDFAPDVAVWRGADFRVCEALANG